jgi:hypothetical protein
VKPTREIIHLQREVAHAIHVIPFFRVGPLLPKDLRLIFRICLLQSYFIIPMASYLKGFLPSLSWEGFRISFIFLAGCLVGCCSEHTSLNLESSIVF